jgi:nitroimidazol reductase NimA-like FMN-containing flavoprotein (pyridoxamine 5'-phosphate oxidase superfamily)
MDHETPSPDKPSVDAPSTAEPTMSPQTWLLYLTDEGCARLLATSTMGRLAVIVDGHPEIFPVNHVLDDLSGCVVFPTTAGTKLHAALDWPSVAFEVDGVEAAGAEGWSVLVIGRAEEITDAGEMAGVAARREVLWAAGEAARWIRIVPTKVTGRRIGAAGR